METRSLGNGGSVSRLGLGLAALGRPGYINLDHAADLHGNYSALAMEANAHGVLDATWSAGIRYFDAARSYGRGEAFLGSWLSSRRIEPAEVVVGSKWGYIYTADWQIQADKHEIKDHSLPVLERQLAESGAATSEQLSSNLAAMHIHLDAQARDRLQDLREEPQVYWRRRSELPWN